MSRALNIFQGRFGRVALLDMDRSLVKHAHCACHVLLKFGGADSAFEVRGKLCPLKADTVVLVNAWEPHSYVHSMGTQNTKILALYIDPVWLAETDGGLSCSSHSRFFPEPCATVTGTVLAGALSLGGKMLLGDVVTSREAEDMVFALMIRIIDSFSDRAGLRGRLGATADHRISKAIHLMRTGMNEPLDIARLAQAARLSRPHFFQRFKQVTGLTPGIFLNTLRMEAAARILVSDDRPLIGVAHDLGFSEHANFTRFFREHQGVAPSEYRRVTQHFV
jgi:AraC family transcriptional regulator